MAWVTQRGEVSGRPAIVLLDRQFEFSAPVVELPQLVWFGVWCRFDPKGAFWDPDETEDLEVVEKNLLTFAGSYARGNGVYVKCVSTPGLREYYFYTAEGTHVDMAIGPLKAIHHNYRIEADVMSDPGWKDYKKFVEWIREGEAKDSVSTRKPH